MRTNLAPHPRRGAIRFLAVLLVFLAMVAGWWWLDAGRSTAASTRVDVAGLQARIADRLGDASEAELLRAHRELSERRPSLLDEAHGARLSTGDYEELDAPRHMTGAPIEYPIVQQRSDAFGLVKVHLLKDGRYVRTELELDEIGGAATWAVEMAWLGARVNATR